jgi:hypothetical protein
MFWLACWYLVAQLMGMGSNGSTRFHTSSLTFQGEVRAMIVHLTVFAVSGAEVFG